MRYPNQRYGNPQELAYYAMPYKLADLARLLRRDERTVRDWMTGRRRVPWWVPDILRLMKLEADERHFQMFGVHLPRQLAVVTHQAQLELRRRSETKKPQPGGLRLDDFDQASG